MEHRTFISYENSDKEVAFKVCDYLESRGILCWIAPRDIRAGEYAGEITRALKSADNIIVICSASTSHSPHVRNEVSLAFGDRCKIIPFVLEDVALDDSLEYYFAGKQRVFAMSDVDGGLEMLYSVLSGEPCSPKIKTENHHGSLFWKVVIIITICLILSFLAYLWLHSHNILADHPSVNQDVPSVIDTAVENEPEAVPEQITADAPAEQPVPSDADTFSGPVTGGYPDGIGKYVFLHERRIDVHDDLSRIASVGDYIVGEWIKGHLVQGKWYGADGELKGVIIIGKALDPESDHIFEKCRKQ